MLDIILCQHINTWTSVPTCYFCWRPLWRGAPILLGCERQYGLGLWGTKNKNLFLCVSEWPKLSSMSPVKWQNPVSFTLCLVSHLMRQFKFVKTKDRNICVGRHFFVVIWLNSNICLIALIYSHIWVQICPFLDESCYAWPPFFRFAR